MSAGAAVRRLTRAALARWPLPAAGDDADKEARGHVLVVAGSEEMPGAALLAAVAALRAGAGKLTVAAPAAVAQGLALAIPEARVIALPQHRGGALHPGSGCEALAPVAGRVQAVVLGPGMQDEARSTAFVQALLPLFSEQCTLVLDTLAMSVATHGALAHPAILTPHAGEMAHLCAYPKGAIEADPLGAAQEAARAWQACVVLKGARTVIATPDGALLRFDGELPGLATSGSGDTLAGLIGGLCARGMAPQGAAAWGVLVHAHCGMALAQRMGPLGYLARELAGEVPGVMRRLGGAQG